MDVFRGEFQEEVPPGFQGSAGLLRQGAGHREAFRPGVEGQGAFVAELPWGLFPVGLGEVGGVGDHQVQVLKPPGEGCGEEGHGEAQPLGVLPGEGEGLGVHLRGVDLRLGQGPLQGQGDGPRARAHVQDPGGGGQGEAEGELHQPFRLGAGDEDPFLHPQGQAEELHLPHQVLERVALEAPLEERLGPVKGLLGQEGGEAAI